MIVNHSPGSLKAVSVFDSLKRHEAVEAGSCCSDQREEIKTRVLLDLLHVIESRDPELLAHGDRTARYAVSLGNRLGLPGADLVNLHYAGVLHDIGKLMVPKAILAKDGPLTADEYALAQSHPRAGAELLMRIPFLHSPALWIAHHHERWDGTGYPYGLRGDFIPLGSRILAVADTYDSLTSQPPTGAARDPASALGVLRVIAGSQLDPGLVEIFIPLPLALHRPADRANPTPPSG